MVALVVVVVAVLAAALGVGVGIAFGRRHAAPVAVVADAPSAFSGADYDPRQVPALVLEVLTHGVAVIDRDERIIAVNPAARSMGVLIGDRLAVPALVKLTRTATDTQRTAHLEIDLPLDRLGREPVALSVAAIPLPESADGHRIAAVALLLEDVSEFRRLEAVRRDFVANVSHELKTPVGALTLLAEAVTEAADDPDAVQRFAGRMQHEGARLGKLVRELIELSRLQGAEPLPGDEPVPLLRVLDEAADRTRLLAEQAGIAVRVSCPEDLAVRGNETQLTMAIANLIDNAIAYSPAGTRVAVSGRATVDDEGRRVADIAVSDQGIGIAESDINRVFERFYRVDPARSRATGGTGLGLAIVKHVATNHGGRVSVWSAEGAGSTFTIRLPRVHQLAESSTPNRDGLIPSSAPERPTAAVLPAKGTV